MAMTFSGRAAAAIAALGLLAGLGLFPTAAFASGKGGGTPGQSGTAAATTHAKGNAGTSGAYNLPQPSSRADKNNTGANTTSPTNPYRSTRSGLPSFNGSGKGNATGRPCAGCVGKADNKDPLGQQPNGTDHNAGYECDRNQGIGKTNPAHTGCTSGSPTPTPTTPPGRPPTTPPPSSPTSPPSPPTSPTTPITPSPSPTTPPHLAAQVTTAAPATSSPTGTQPAATPGAPVPRVATSGHLAFTGSDLIGEATAGLAALGLGGLVVRGARRRSGSRKTRNLPSL
jgi:hypothetical protein